MQIDFKGADCVVIKAGQTSLVFNDNLKELGGKSVISKDDVVCWTKAPTEAARVQARLWIDCPGRYEIGDFVLNGWPALSPSHGSSEAAEPATIYQGIAVKTGISFVVIGNIAPELDDAQIANITPVDILILPVGGKYSDDRQTLDAAAAGSVVRHLNPGLVIPTHYSEAMPRLAAATTSVADFLKATGLDSEEVSGSLRVKKKDLTETPIIKILSSASGKKPKK